MEDEINLNEPKVPAGPSEGATSSPSSASLPSPQATLEQVLDQTIRVPRHQKRRAKSAAGSKTRKIKAGENPNQIGGKEKGTKQAHISPKVKQTRNELMLAAHLSGQKITEIAEVFGVSRLTVSEGITDAQRATYFGDARDYVRFRLIPKALRVMDLALDEGNVDVALRVTEGANVTGPRAVTYDLTDAGQRTAGSASSDDFESWRLEFIRKRGFAAAPEGGTQVRSPQGPSGPSGDVIDAEAVEASAGAKARQPDHQRQGGDD